MWLKYRTKWSSGIGEWDFIYFSSDSRTRITKKELEESIIPSITNKYNYSEHFRGIDWIKIKHPPKEFFKKFIEQKEKHVLYCAKELKIFKDKFKKYYKEY